MNGIKNNKTGYVGLEEQKIYKTDQGRIVISQKKSVSGVPQVSRQVSSQIPSIVHSLCDQEDGSKTA